MHHKSATGWDDRWPAVHSVERVERACQCMVLRLLGTCCDPPFRLRNRMVAVMLSGRTGPRPQAYLLMLCLGAILTGIIGMHLWMGGHGEYSDAHGVHSTSATTSPAGSDMTGVPNFPGLSAEHHPMGDGFPMLGCVGTCDAGDLAAGICVLSLIVLAMFVLLLPPRQVLRHSLRRRDPPLHWRGIRFAPTPSLTQLGISRT